MSNTTPNMNITIGVLTDVTTFAGFTDTFVFVRFNVSIFPNIRRIITFNANLGIFTNFGTFSNSHTNESWTTTWIVRAMVIIEHTCVTLFTKLVTNATIFMPSWRFEHGKGWLVFSTMVYLAAIP